MTSPQSMTSPQPVKSRKTMKSMSLRWIALGLGLCAFALRLTYVFTVQPLTWHLGMTRIMLTVALAYAVSLGVPAAIFVYLVGFRLPARLEERPKALVAPPTPSSIGMLVILVMWMMGGAIVTERIPGGDAMRVARIEYAVPVSAITLGLFALIAVLLAVVVDRPRVEFTADELIIRNAYQTVRLAWERLAPGGPFPPHKRQRYLRLYLNEPPVMGAYPPSVDIRLSFLYVDSAYLADTIRGYVEAPAHRAALPGGGKPQGAPSF